MTTQMETQSDQERRSLYIGVAVVFAVLAVVVLLMFKAGSTNQAAEAKAAQLAGEIQKSGAKAPPTKVMVKLFGDDGGAVCEDPNGALSRATLVSLLSTGTGGVGQRPIIADSKVAKGEELILQVYCPEELADFQDFVHDLNLAQNLAGS